MWTRILLGWRSSLATRIVGVILLTQAALLPVLYLQLDRTAWSSNSDLFDSLAQDYLAQRASELSAGRIPITDEALTQFLDGIVESGFVAHGEVRLRDHIVRASSTAPLPLYQHGVADVIDRGDDHVYYLDAAWHHGTDSGTLLLGFDESFIHARASSVRYVLLFEILGYLALVVAAGLVLARFLTRPLNLLGDAARRIAAGNLAQALETSTGIREVDDLSRNLEQMRRALDVLAARMHQRQRLATVGTLAGGVSHEFNNVLLPIILYLESAQDALPEGHAAREPVSRALAAAGRARDIVAKLLVFSRHSTGTPLASVSIAPAVDEALRLFAPICPSYISLRSDLAAGCDPVLADTGLIVQVVMNLCTNAYQAIPATGGVIRVDLANVEADGVRMVQLTVEDSGSGMDAEARARVFEPFFTTREVGRGSGLGLAVVHGIIAELHGTIEVDSQPGVGSKFTIRLPSVTGEA